MKGNADCHIPNDKYREGWDRIRLNKIKKEADAFLNTLCDEDSYWDGVCTSDRGMAEGFIGKFLKFIEEGGV